MPEHLANLRRAGTILIVAEGLNIVWNLFHMDGEGFSFTADLLAIVAGVYLIRGSLPAARVARWFSAFTLALMIPLAIAIPFWFPGAYLATALRLQPRPLLLIASFALLLFGLLFWVFSELTSGPVEAALAGLPGKPWTLPLAWVFGAAAGVVLAGLLLSFIHGQSAQQAVAQVREANGPAYRYFVSSLNVSIRNGERRVSATVVAFNPEEIRYIPVAWND